MFNVLQQTAGRLLMFTVEAKCYGWATNGFQTVSHVCLQPSISYQRA